MAYNTMQGGIAQYWGICYNVSSSYLIVLEGGNNHARIDIE